MKFNSLSVKLKDHATIFISKHSENYIVVFKIVILIDFSSFEAFHILRFKNKLKKCLGSIKNLPDVSLAIILAQSFVFWIFR
jgi:hypothetical protein